jgi:putative DNA primase/helicase
MTAATVTEIHPTSKAPGSPALRPTGGSVPAGLPRIIIPDRELRDMTADALKALELANQPPVLFRRGSVLIRVRQNDTSGPALEALSDAALRGLLTRVADWAKITRTGLEAVSPPLDVVQDVLSLGEWPRIPRLEAVVETPIFASDGTLVTSPGYHPAARLWFHRARGFVIPEIVSQPTRAQIEEARELLLTELLGEFPLQDDASLAHILAATLLPFVREMIPGPTPLHLIDAPSPGTGKGLLADVMTVPATGRSATIMAEGQDDEEWRKRITAVLMGGPTFVVVDNLRRQLDSAALSAALTGTTWTDRILGHTTMATVPVRAVWMATGNNITLSNEMARRSVWIRMDAKVDRPWTRSGFRHPKLKQWAAENRGRLVHACLTLIQAWIAAERPQGGGVLGSFEAWAETMGGILKVAGVPGFLGNIDQLYEQADDEVRTWREFVVAWYEHFKSQRLGAEELYCLAERENLLPEVLGDGGERSKRTRLGKALGRMKDRVIGQYRIVGDAEDGRGRRRYHLEPSQAVPT